MKKNIKNLQTEKEKTGQKLLNRFVMPLVKPVSRWIRLDPAREAKLASTLRRGGIDLTPREYRARALIEAELPSFVRSILYKLDDIREGSQKTVVQVDLIQIFEDYLMVANDVFRYDVSVLVMEMKAKNIETALRNFNERIGLTDVSFLVNALIGLYRGEHQGEALAYLARDMDVKAKEALKKKLNKLPGKIKIASIPLVAVTLATLLYVIGSHLIRSMGGLF